MHSDITKRAQLRAHSVSSTAITQTNAQQKHHKRCRPVWPHSTLLTGKVYPKDWFWFFWGYLGACLQGRVQYVTKDDTPHWITGRSTKDVARPITNSQKRGNTAFRSSWATARNRVKSDFKGSCAIVHPSYAAFLVPAPRNEHLLL